MKKLLTVAIAVLALGSPAVAQQDPANASQTRVESNIGVAGAKGTDDLTPFHTITKERPGFRGANYEANLAHGVRDLEFKPTSQESYLHQDHVQSHLTTDYSMGDWHPRANQEVIHEDSLVHQRSTYFGSTVRRRVQPIAPHIPGAESHARMALDYYFQAKSGSTGFTVYDPMSKQTWNLRASHTAVLAKQADESYVAQLPCYGGLGSNAQAMPVVLQFKLKGKGKTWTVVGNPTIVSANNLCRAGQSVMAKVDTRMPMGAAASVSAPASQHN